MNKRNTVLTIMCTVALLLICGVVFAVEPSQQAEAYAHKIFPQLMEDCVQNIDNISYFNNVDEAKIACLGEPIIVYTLNSIDPDKSLIKQIEPSSWYVFPVELNGKPVTDIRVTLVNGNWVWDFGGSLTPMINQVASENSILPKDCIAVMLGQPGPTYIVANKDDKDVAVRNYKNQESLKLTSEGVQDIKKSLDAKQILEQNITSDENIVGGTAVSKASFEQNANIWQRVINYLTYLCNN